MLAVPGWARAADAAPEPPHGIRPVLGLEWRPLSRADLTWVDEGRTTGLAVGELDGAVRPALSGFFGAWVSRRVGLMGSIGVARLTSTTFTQSADGETTYRSRHWGVIRPALDVRLAPWGHDRMVSAWAIVGVHGDIPSARDVSNAYTEEEQEIADETAAEDRVRLGGFGGRLGIGAEVHVGKGVHVGGQYAVYWQQTVLAGSDADTLSSWVAGEASLLLAIEFGGSRARPSGDSSDGTGSASSEPQP
jgi:hypothetical protein